MEKEKNEVEKEKKQKGVVKSIFQGIGIVWILIIVCVILSPVLGKVLDLIPDGTMPYIGGAIIALVLLAFLIDMIEAIRDKKAGFMTYVCLLAFIIDAVIAINSGMRLYEQSKDLKSIVEYGVVSLINGSLETELKSGIGKEKNTLLMCVLAAFMIMGIYESCKEHSEKAKARREKKLAAENSGLPVSENMTEVTANTAEKAVAAPVTERAEPAVADVVEAKAEAEDREYYCRYCGAKMPAIAKFCRNCGEKV